MQSPSIFAYVALNVRPERVTAKHGDVLLIPDAGRFATLFSRFMIASVIVFAFVLFVAWRIAEVIAQHTLAPLVRTTDALSRFAEGDFTPAPVSTSDRSELGRLARAYNGAVAQITYAFDELSKGEAEMRQFVADAGHQLRTPLTVVMGHLSGLAARAGNTPDAPIYARMLDESRRMKALIDDLIVLAKLEHPVTEKFAAIEAGALVEHVVTSFGGIAKGRLRFAGPKEPVYVLGAETELFSAVSALVDNALKYAGDSGIVVGVRAEEHTVILEVLDGGPGLNESDRERVFDRFYRGETSHGIVGTGLGLAIVRRSVERAEGSLVIENRAAGGLCCRILLPAVAG